MIRNPIYLDIFCFALSGVLLLKIIAMAFVICITILFYVQFVVRAEEGYLEGKFDDKFKNHLECIPKFLPSFSWFNFPDSVNESCDALRSRPSGC
jgi:protein-S-isoprenylcysteine O-methyltransferase Ste14